MSRSYQHHNIIGMAATSEKQDKKAWHKKMRSKCNKLCQTKIREDDFTANDFPVTNEVVNPWGMHKDGKMFFEPWMCIKDHVKKFFTRKGKLRK